MKKWMMTAVALAYLTQAGAAPYSETTLATYRSRLAFYAALGMKPSAVCLSLRNYFGKPFQPRYNQGDDTTDIVLETGEGTNVTFLATIGTLKGQPD